MEKRSVGMVIDGVEFIHPTRHFEPIRWELVSEEFHERFYEIWASSFNCEPIDGEKCWLLDTLGWMINNRDFNQETTIDEAWKTMTDWFISEDARLRGGDER